MSQEKIIVRKKGKVLSDKMTQTLVVAVNTLKTHPKYHKKYRSTKKYKVHDPESRFHIGDVVEFVQCRPISKDKKFIVVYQN
ncbi:30S ribosomal protein S17 [Patescibacteria group bacterium]|nr:MAG: 30S ribosomal protein S17 [Patescibacteria group bacterium]